MREERGWKAMATEKRERTKERTEISPGIIPSQSDIFRAIGERLSVGIGRGGKQEGTPLGCQLLHKFVHKDWSPWVHKCAISYSKVRVITY